MLASINPTLGQCSVFVCHCDRFVLGMGRMLLTACFTRWQVRACLPMSTPWIHACVLPVAEMSRCDTKQQTTYVHPMLGQCWATVVDSRPALSQHRVNALCFLDII